MTRHALTWLLLLCACSLALADSYDQYSVPPQQPAVQQLLAPDQLGTLVAPVALYPDPLLGQILAASTYPLELVEAQQWLQQNRNLRGQSLIQAAQQQNWDPSIQVIVAFPQAVDLLTRDIRWTTGLGNAFLAQQAGVMDAIQALRLQARDSGRLASTPQQIVSTEAQNGQYAVQIQPANPQVLYPPVYDPAAIWGPAPYASSDPGSYSNGSNGYGFGSGLDLGSIFSSLLSWGSWGWIPGWFSHSLSLAGLFFNILGFHGFGGSGYGAGYSGAGALALWTHNPAHRLGVAYPTGYNSYNRTIPATNSWGHFGSANAAFRPNSIDRRTGMPTYSSQTYRSPVNALPQRTASNFQSQSFQNFRGPASSRIQPFESTRSEPGSFSTARSTPNNLSTTRLAPNSFSTTRLAPRGSPQAPKNFSKPPKISAPKFSAPKNFGHASAPKHSGGGGHTKSSHKH